MSLTSEMKNLTEDIVASFKNRMKGNEELIIEVQHTLDGFRKDHQEMANVLKSNAAALRGKMNGDEKDRLNKYNELIKSIRFTISSMQNEISMMLKGFTDARKQMSDDLNDFFAKNRAGRNQDEKNRLDEFNKLMKSITDEVTAIFKYTSDLLAQFDKEHLNMSAELKSDLAANMSERFKYVQEMIAGINEWLMEISKENQKLALKLKKDLANGEAERMKEYNGMMKGIQSELKNMRHAIATMVGGFSKDRAGAAIALKKMSDAIAEIRKSGLSSFNKTDTKKTEVKKEIPVEVKKEIPAEPKKEFIPIDDNAGKKKGKTLN
ncbi:MAG: hypothetical protein ACOYN6_11145 [Ignavibacteria bacterium]